MRALRNAAAALALSSMLILAGQADGGQNALPGDSEADETETSAPGAYEKAKGDALDAYIAGRLITAYNLSEHLNPFHIGVGVRDAKVVLTGAVENSVQRDLALEIARGVEQARSVTSKIAIDPKAQRPEPAAQNDLSFARRYADAGITARVKTRLLWNDNTRDLSTRVNTEQRAVTLSGTVESVVERALAEQIALNTGGVERVENRLQVVADSRAQLRAMNRGH